MGVKEFKCGFQRELLGGSLLEDALLPQRLFSLPRCSSAQWNASWGFSGGVSVTFIWNKLGFGTSLVYPRNFFCLDENVGALRVLWFNIFGYSFENQPFSRLVPILLHIVSQCPQCASSVA